MATTIKALSRGSFSTSSATLYTVPSTTTTVVTNISVCNLTTGDITFNILLDGVYLFKDTVVAQKTTALIDLKQAISATKILSGFASDTNVTYHITGAEIA